MKCFPSTLRRRNLYLRKTRVGKSHDYRKVIVFDKLRFQNVFLRTLKRKAAVFKSPQFEERFRKALFFPDGLVWTEGLTVERKLRFQISPV